MTATLHQFPPPHARPRRSRLIGSLSSDRVAKLADYQLRFDGGVLSYGHVQRVLGTQEAQDLAHVIHWARLSSNKRKPSTSTQIPGISVIAHGPKVQILGFGPAIRGVQVDELIYQLNRFRRASSGAKK